MFVIIKITMFAIPIMNRRGYAAPMTDNPTQTTRTVSATDLRGTLTQVLESLDEKGPMLITDYGEVVAEIRSAKPDAEAAHTQRWFDLYEALNERELLNAANSKLRTFDALTELVRLFDVYTKQGVDLNHGSLWEFPEALFPDEILANIYFGGNPPADEPVEWFKAFCEIHKAAKERGLSQKLPQGEYESSPSLVFYTKAVEAGHTPATFATFCIQALDQGVPLYETDQLLGSEAIPADVLALKSFSSYMFESLLGAGLSHAEAVAVFRQNISPYTAEKFANAGVRSASDIGLLVDTSFDPDLALRAHRGELTFEQWRKILPKVQKHNYEKEGLLPFSVIAEAAAKGVSLVRWDKNSAIDNSLYGAKGKKSTNAYPWRLVYNGQVIRLAEAGIAPTYVKDFGDLFSYHYTDTVDDELFAAELIELRAAGLTSDLIKALSKLENRPNKFVTPKFVRTLFSAGITVHRAKHIGDMTNKHDTWFWYLHDMENFHTQVTEFIEARKDSQGWQDVLAVTRHFTSTQKLAKHLRYDFGLLAVEAISLLDTPDKLLRAHLTELFHSACWLLRLDNEGGLRSRGDKDAIAGKTDAAVHTLWDEFNAMIKNLSSPAVSDEEHRVERINEGRELPQGTPAIEA